jgi:hypothetical protein
MALHYKMYELRKLVLRPKLLIWDKIHEKSYNIQWIENTFACHC